MRIFNGTNSQINFPFNGDTIKIDPLTPSTNLLATNELLGILITTFSSDEISFIVSGTFELATCANMRIATDYVSQSLEETIEKFTRLREKKAAEEAAAKKMAEEINNTVAEAKAANTNTAAPQEEIIPQAEVKVEEKSAKKASKASEKKGEDK